MNKNREGLTAKLPACALDGGASSEELKRASAALEGAPPGGKRGRTVDDVLGPLSRLGEDVVLNLLLQSTDPCLDEARAAIEQDAELARVWGEVLRHWRASLPDPVEIVAGAKEGASGQEPLQGGLRVRLLRIPVVVRRS